MELVGFSWPFPSGNTKELWCRNICRLAWNSSPWGHSRGQCWRLQMRSSGLTLFTEEPWWTQLFKKNMQTNKKWSPIWRHLWVLLLSGEKQRKYCQCQFLHLDGNEQTWLPLPVLKVLCSHAATTESRPWFTDASASFDLRPTFL